MFELQPFHSGLPLEDVHVLAELADGVPGQVQFEGQFANLVVDEAGGGFDLGDIRICGPDLHQQQVGLAVVLVSRVQISFQLIQETCETKKYILKELK